MKRELEQARAELSQRKSGSAIIGRSPPMLRLLDRIDTIAQSDAPVLITGESGTGKELVARTLHERSTRRARPFIAVNCAAFPETLLEAELFGHERGAFTGAVKRRDGRFKAADGAVRCCSTRSPRSRWPRRPSSCAFCRRERSNRSVPTRSPGSTSESSRQPTATCGSASKTADSARICTTG